MPVTSPEHLPTLMAWLGFLAGGVFGAAAQRANFCTMGAITDIFAFGDWRRMRMWVLAIAVAIAGVAVLQRLDMIDTAKSLYTGTRIAVLSLVVGGFLFGFGMTIASGCGSKTLIRIGGGSLKALIVMIFLGLAAFMTLKGLFAIWRTAALDPVRIDLGATSSDLPALLAAAGAPAVASGLPFVVALAIAFWVFASRDFRRSREMVVGGLIIGAVVVAGWYITGHVGYLAEDPATLEERFVGTNSGRMESLSYVAPVAYLLELLVYWTDASRLVTFGIASALGTIAGAALMALARKTFRWEGFTSTDDLVHHIAGGTLMGFGGVTALGCTIGQGISGVSTLAVGSFVALASIVAGCVVALHYQMWRLERAAPDAGVNAVGRSDVSSA